MVVVRSLSLIFLVARTSFKGDGIGPVEPATGNV